jgi:Cu/Ag efflux protein CusF
MKKTMQVFGMAFLGAALLMGCGAGDGKKAAEASKAAENHSSSGVIMEVKDQGKTLVIQHQDFPGFMKGMTMPFEVETPAMAQGLKVGDKVDFTISKRENGFPITQIKKQ